MFFYLDRSRLAYVNPLLFATFLATNIYAHSNPWICIVIPYNELRNMRVKEVASACRQ